MKKIIFSLICINVFICFYLLNYHSDAQLKTHKKKMVCTTSILADTAKRIAGDDWHVVSLMGPGVDPHTYNATEHDVHALAQADLILYHGLHLEGKMVHVLEQMNQYTTSVGVCDSLPKELLLESEVKGIYDPHVWHDVSLWNMVTTTIATALCTADTVHADTYQHNAQNYSTRLTQLDALVYQLINQIPQQQRVLITAHDAFSYFGKRYGIKVMGLQGVSTDSEAGTRDIQQLVQFITRNKIKALFVESSISPRNIQAVQQGARSQGWQVAIGPELYSDALGDEQSNADSYVSMIEYNVKTISQTLK